MDIREMSYHLTCDTKLHSHKKCTAVAGIPLTAMHLSPINV